MGPKKPVAPAPRSAILKPLDQAQLSSVYTLLGQHQYAQALKLAQTLETRFGPHQNLLMIKFFCLTKQKAPREEIHAVSTALAAQNPTNIGCLNQWFQSGLISNHIHDAVLAIQAAYPSQSSVSSMGELFILSALASSYGINYIKTPFAKITNVCDTLRSQTKSSKYSAWAALFALLNNPATGPSNVLLNLENIIKKSYPLTKVIESASSGAMPRETFGLLLRLLILQAKSNTDGCTQEDRTQEKTRMSDGLSYLQSAYGTDLKTSDPTEFSMYQCQFMLRNGDIKGAIDLLQGLIKEFPDNWLWVTTYLYLHMFSWFVQSQIEKCVGESITTGAYTAKGLYATLANVKNSLVPSISVLTACSPSGTISSESLSDLFCRLSLAKHTLIFPTFTLSLDENDESGETACVSSTNSLTIVDQALAVDSWLGDFENTLSSQASVSRMFRRAISLGRVELYRLLVSFSLSQPDTLQQPDIVLFEHHLLQKFVSYFILVGSKPCFYDDISLSLGTLYARWNSNKTISKQLLHQLMIQVSNSFSVVESDCGFQSVLEDIPVLGALSFYLHRHVSLQNVLQPEEIKSIAISSSQDFMNVPVLNERGALFLSSLTTVDRFFKLQDTDKMLVRDFTMIPQELVVNPSSTDIQHVIEHHMNCASRLVALHSAFEKSQTPETTKEKNARSLEILTRRQNHLELPIDESRLFSKSETADIFLLLAAYYLYDCHLLQESSETKPSAMYLYLAIALLENGLLSYGFANPSEQPYLLKIFLIRLYAHPLIGNIERVADLQAELSIKQIQSETLFHLIAPECLRWGLPLKAAELYQGSYSFISSLQQSTSSNALECLARESYSQIEDFFDLCSRTETSISALSAHVGLVLTTLQTLPKKSFAKTIDCLTSQKLLVHDSIIPDLRPLVMQLQPLQLPKHAVKSNSKQAAKQPVKSAAITEGKSSFEQFVSIISNSNSTPNNQDYTIASTFLPHEDLTMDNVTSASLNLPGYPKLHNDIMVPSSSIFSSSFEPSAMKSSSIKMDIPASRKLTNTFFTSPTSTVQGLSMQLFWLPKIFSLDFSESEVVQFEEFVSKIFPTEQGEDVVSMGTIYEPLIEAMKIFHGINPAVPASLVPVVEKSCDMVKSLVKSVFGVELGEKAEKMTLERSTIHTKDIVPLYTLISTIFHAVGTIVSCMRTNFPASSKAAWNNAMKPLAQQVTRVVNFLRSVQFSGPTPFATVISASNTSLPSSCVASVVAFLNEQNDHTKVISFIENQWNENLDALVRSHASVYGSVADLLTNLD